MSSELRRTRLTRLTIFVGEDRRLIEGCVQEGIQYEFLFEHKQSVSRLLVFKKEFVTNSFLNTIVQRSSSVLRQLVPMKYRCLSTDED